MAARSLAARSLAAVFLMVGFYVLAVAVVALLLFIPYAEWTYGARIHIQLAIGCVLGAVAIALAILPRRDRFLPPGPSLHPEDHPDLFAKLGEVSQQTGQELPKEVYLLPEMNAWVANRGGVMGIGSRRIMGVGLPLLQVTTVAELEAILAHEFGHYHGGDTRLGPWIYKTRSAIGRTLESLGDEGVLHLPFRWYGNFFLRITQAISRAQEFTADRLAATVVGAEALIEGLKKVHAYAAPFGAYWQQEAVPVLQAGYHAPLVDGFTRFLGVPRIEKAVAEMLSEQLEATDSDPYDSHPPLRERIRAVEDLGGAKAAPKDSERPAIGLIGELDATERALIASLSGDDGTSGFEAVDWDDVVARVFVPAWTDQAKRLAPTIGDATLGDLEQLLNTRGRQLGRVALGQDAEVPEEHLLSVLSGALGSCLAVALIDGGWTPTARVGEPVTVERGGVALEPFALLPQFYEHGAGWWSELLEHNGIAALPLARQS